MVLLAMRYSARSGNWPDLEEEARMDLLAITPVAMAQITRHLDELNQEAQGIVLEAGNSGAGVLPPRYTEITGTLKGIGFVLAAIMVPDCG